MDLKQFIQSVPLNEATRAILDETQGFTGKPFRFEHNPDLPVQAFVKIARSSMSHHIITYSGTDTSLLNHHIAHECGHILRYYAAPPASRLMPVSDEQTNRASIAAIEKSDRGILRSLPLDLRYQIIPIWIKGLINQLTNLPPDLYIERWLFETYPALRDDQRRSLEQTHREAVSGLDPALRSRFPRLVIDGSLAMNFAFYRKIDEKTGSGFFKEFKRSSGRKAGEKLYKSIRDDDTGLVGGIALINTWADVLQVRDWFKWGDFEDIPPDYETRGF